ncbi:MAG: hypothetical protein GY772_11755, partial [bacterium]|nr:hypothetical protein [bacterium]
MGSAVAYLTLRLGACHDRALDLLGATLDRAEPAPQHCLPLLVEKGVAGTQHHLLIGDRGRYHLLDGFLEDLETPRRACASVESAGRRRGRGRAGGPLGTAGLLLSHSRIGGIRLTDHLPRGVLIKDGLPATGSHILPIMLGQDLVLMLLRHPVILIQLDRGRLFFE